MISPHPLDRLVAQDTLREILSLLEPGELVVAVLRLEGLSDTQISDLLGITRSTVGLRIQQARERLIQRLPELAPVLRDRRQPHQKPPSNETPPLEHGWLCRWTDDEPDPLPELTADLTTQDVADRYNVTTQAVTRWIRAGRFPNAYRLDGRRGDYRIPESDLAGFQAGVGG